MNGKNEEDKLFTTFRKNLTNKSSDNQHFKINIKLRQTAKSITLVKQKLTKS